MRHLILSAAIPALLLGACSSVPAQQYAEYNDPPVMIPREAPPHFPRDLTPAGVAAADDHLALEQVDGAEAMAFVAEENRKSLAVLTGDPRYETFRAEAQAILTATDRIPSPSFLGDGVGNFWQDANNPKGVWRRTTLASYRTATPQWDTLLDIDALSRAEGKDWVFKGADCLAPDDARCLIMLSDGGKDAVVVREFDLPTKRFVEDGFRLPEGKHRIEWLDRDTLLVATDFGAGTMTESGYPFIVKTLKRGQTLAQATEVYRGKQGDGGYGVSPAVYRDKDGKVTAVIITRPLDTFRSETWQLTGDGKTQKLALPERVGISGVIDGRLVFSPDQAWRFDGQDYAAGSLLALPMAVLGETRIDILIDRDRAVVFEPTARQALQGVAVLSDTIVAAITDNVAGRLMKFRPGETGWTASSIAVPDNLAVGLGDSSKSRGEVFVSTQGFLVPPTLSLANVGAATLTTLKSAPAKFDASRDITEQYEAISTDGTKIPYFITRPRDMKLDGSNPTIMLGYGGFQVSLNPAYKPEMGKLWLERGGVFVQANIRGGGEFGPDWHQAALKENRQRAFDDFAAVARDLEQRGVTSPRRLGIYGRSNGGVLTSVSITQHPELFNAAVIESPLVDMLRYQDLPAGASWIGEYGDPRIPADAAFIARYSAYQQLRPGAAYPRVYLTTNTRDDRVHPGHARKFAARLGDLGYDHLYYEDTAGGHSNDADPVANARRWARHYVYLAQQLMD
ncbi:MULTISPECIES: prolyl oligopeptidase family serine peptidase [unclassified Brevundimonas]|uniref:prolyl oligopeptidase family serine peptidase n=2 Tax=Brevundimonas TaxID=41275 RepID=UPI0020058FA3|nr:MULTISPECIES: prolyl oligopeptidase family serine peptidase [unclassified Brevundimonas]MCK6105636.1 prolyl oligopeptidase family serine peptidase [Brevundimonas sp. EYE_349]